MIDGWKIPKDIATQDMGKSVTETFVSGNGTMCALADALMDTPLALTIRETCAALKLGP